MTHEEKILDSIEVLGDRLILQKLPGETVSKGGVILTNKTEHFGIGRVVKVGEWAEKAGFRVNDILWFPEYALADIPPLNERKGNKEKDSDYPNYFYINITDITARAMPGSAYGQMIEGE